MTSNNRRNGRRRQDEATASTGEAPGQVAKLQDAENIAHLAVKKGQEQQTSPAVHTPVVSPNEPDLGTTIRRLREARQLSLKEVAERSGLTPSFLSQVERNLTSPSVASLRNVAQAFGVPLTALFQGPMSPEDHVVRRSERRQLVHPRRQWRDCLLTPNLTGRLQVILSVIEPGGGSGDEPYAHDSDEECV